MESVGITHYVAVAAGFILIGACAYSVVRLSPTPYRNIALSVVALGLFAVGTGTRLARSIHQDS